MPKYSILLMVFTLGSLGLPGTTGFIGEFLILMGTFKKNFLVAAIASLGVILGAAYMLWLYKRIVFGELTNQKLLKIIDLNKVELSILTLLALSIIFFGFYPDPFSNTYSVSVENFLNEYNDKLNNYNLQNQ